MKPLLILIASCFIAATTHAQHQGVEGEIFWLGGNQMPGPGNVSSPQQGVVREVYIYNATRVADAELVNGFYTNITTQLIAKTMSDVNGHYKVKLAPGAYSVFVKEPNGLFANLIDGKGLINCVMVKPKKYSWLTISIDYDAAY